MRLSCSLQAPIRDCPRAHAPVGTGVGHPALGKAERQCQWRCGLPREGDRTPGPQVVPGHGAEFPILWLLPFQKRLSPGVRVCRVSTSQIRSFNLKL